MNPLRILNIILAIAIFILILNLLEPTIIGSAIHSLDTGSEKCSFNGEEIPVNLCCPELEKQLTCDPLDDNVKCYISPDSENYYIVNYKTISYCLKNGYDV